MTTKRASVLVLIVLVVLGVGLTIIAIHSLRELANSQATKSRMKDLVVAMHSCDDLHRCLPPAYDAFADIEYPASLHVHLLRFIKETDLYTSLVQSGGTPVDDTVVGFHSPSDASLGTGTGVQNYAANLRVFSDAGLALGSTGNVQGTSPASRYGTVPLAAIMPGHAKIRGTFINGTSNAMCFATKFAVCGEGGSQFGANPTSPFAAFFGESAAERPAHPTEPEATFQLAPRRDKCRFWPLTGQSFSSTGITVAMGDGSVRNILPSVATDVWNRALQPNDSYGYCCGCDW